MRTGSCGRTSARSRKPTTRSRRAGTRDRSQPPAFEPEGQRGDAPLAAARYWGLTQQEDYARADVWPLNPQGELLVIIMCEEVKAIDNLPQILSEVPGHRRRADR